MALGQFRNRFHPAASSSFHYPNIIGWKAVGTLLADFSNITGSAWVHKPDSPQQQRF